MLNDPKLDRKIHMALTLLFAAQLPPAIFWWKDSIPYLVALSVWANVAAHYGAWQAAKAEDRIDTIK